MEKRCWKCEKTKPASEFHRCKERADGLNGICKACNAEKQLERNYGITQADYDEMHTAQAGKCAICGEEETAKRDGKLMKLAVDHCHETSKVRGLLCANCNIILGRARDRVEVLEAAITYLKDN